MEEYECPPGFYIKPESRAAPFNLPKIRDTEFEMLQLDEETFLKFVAKEGLQKSYQPGRGLFNAIKNWLP